MILHKHCMVTYFLMEITFKLGKEFIMYFKFVVTFLLDSDNFCLSSLQLISVKSVSIVFKGIPVSSSPISSVFGFWDLKRSVQ